MLTGTGIALALLSATGTAVSAQSTLAWDKTFPRSAKVDHQKVTFYDESGYRSTFAVGAVALCASAIIAGGSGWRQHGRVR